MISWQIISVLACIYNLRNTQLMAYVFFYELYDSVKLIICCNQDSENEMFLTIFTLLNSSTSLTSRPNRKLCIWLNGTWTILILRIIYSSNFNNTVAIMHYSTIWLYAKTYVHYISLRKELTNLLLLIQLFCLSLFLVKVLLDSLLLSETLK